MITDLLTIWWVWLVAALVFAIVEVLVPGHVLLGFAIGAALVGLLMLGPTSFFLSAPALILLFAILSLVAWLILRRIFRPPGRKAKTFNYDIND